MTKIALIYPPFCTPASPPYSITNIAAFLRTNLSKKDKVTVIDLNLEFHKTKFPEYLEYCRSLEKGYGEKQYDEKTTKFLAVAKDTYSQNHRLIRDDEKPEMFDELLKQITRTKPDFVAFSIVYSSQAFYAYALIKALDSLKIKTIVGGPAVNSRLAGIAGKVLGNEVELLEYIAGYDLKHDELNCDAVLDFSEYDLKNYFTPEPVIPIKTVSTCYYRQCAFCTHYNNQSYLEFDLDNIKETIEKAIKKSKARHFFFIDDMIHKKRLLDIAKMVKPLKINWACQLKPIAELDKPTLKILRESGLSMIMWGIESGSDRILKLIRKGTNIKDIQTVLQDSHASGIKNIAYIIFGFPTETKEEFIETIEFLKTNDEYIDLVSTSIFGLQKGTYIYNNPEKYCITKIRESKRTILEPKIDYELSSGLSNEEAKKMRKRYMAVLEKIDKFPKKMNFFREHMLCLI